MRNAAGTADHNGHDRPRSKARRHKTRAGGGKRGTPRRLTLARSARVAAVGSAALIAIGITVNALALQKGHHPAPLFGKAAGSMASAAARKGPPAPRAVIRSAEADASSTPAKPIKTLMVAHGADSSNAPDLIGRLLDSPSSQPLGTPEPGDGANQKEIAGVQRALTKLGFKVAATGKVGPATKRAIEAFERDRRMPVGGEVNRRLVNVLAAESGIKLY